MDTVPPPVVYTSVFPYLSCHDLYAFARLNRSFFVGIWDDADLWLQLFLRDFVASGADTPHSHLVVDGQALQCISIPDRSFVVGGLNSPLASSWVRCSSGSHRLLSSGPQDTANHAADPTANPTANHAADPTADPTADDTPCQTPDHPTNAAGCPPPEQVVLLVFMHHKPSQHEQQYLVNIPALASWDDLYSDKPAEINTSPRVFNTRDLYRLRMETGSVREASIAGRPRVFSTDHRPPKRRIHTLARALVRMSLRNQLTARRSVHQRQVRRMAKESALVSHIKHHYLGAAPSNWDVCVRVDDHRVKRNRFSMAPGSVWINMTILLYNTSCLGEQVQVCCRHSVSRVYTFSAAVVESVNMQRCNLNRKMDPFAFYSTKDNFVVYSGTSHRLGNSLKMTQLVEANAGKLVRLVPSLPRSLRAFTSFCAQVLNFTINETKALTR